jgi:type IX secretion system PorP/SprF family membrane protein
MKTIKISIIGLMLSFGFYAKGQQVPQFTQYYQNMFMVNPAATGAENYLDIKSGYRQQWSGMTNAPQTFFATATGNLNSFNQGSKRIRTSNDFSGASSAIQNHGFGVSVMSDRFGMMNQTLAMLSYAQHYKLTSKINFSAGLTVGFAGVNFDADGLSVNQGGDNSFENFVNNGANTSFLDGNFGLMVYSEQFFAGYSVNHLFEDQVRLGGNEIGTFYQRQHQFMGGVKISTNNEMWDILPGFLVRTIPGSSTIVDANVRVKYNQMVWLGVSYRDQESFGAAAGVILNNTLNFSYSYDFATGMYQQFSTGSHELVLGINLNAFGKRVNRYLW